MEPDLIHESLFVLVFLEFDALHLAHKEKVRDKRYIEDIEKGREKRGRKKGIKERE